MAAPGAVGLSIHGERRGQRLPQQANPWAAAPAHEVVPVLRGGPHNFPVVHPILDCMAVALLPWRRRQGEVEIRPREVAALAEQRFAELPREGVGEAVSVVEPGRVASLPEVD